MRLFVCKRSVVTTLLASGLFLLGCGGGSKAKIRITPNVVAGTQTSAVRIGSPAATDLHSLKYYIISIQLCENVQGSGSGYSSAEGCIQLYQNPNAGGDYATYTVSQAQADTTEGHFIDLMTADGQAALRKPVTLEVPIAKDDSPDSGSSSQAGVYRFGLINFYRPIKVTAEFPILGQAGQYFRTRADTNIITGMTPDGFNTNRVQIDDTLSGPTEETVYMLNNGGALFTFQKPFTVTQADVDAQAEIKVDLVFNPENFGQAYQTDNCTNDPNNAICDPVNNVVIDMPYVRMNPVPRKAGEKTRKETYLMDYDAASQLRIELYYNDADPEASVQGVDAAVVYTGVANGPNNNMIASNFVSQSGSVTTTDAQVTLMDYQHTPNLEGLLRRQNGTATIHCLFAGVLCPTVGGTVTRAYTYVGDTVVSVD